MRKQENFIFLKICKKNLDWMARNYLKKNNKKACFREINLLQLVSKTYKKMEAWPKKILTFTGVSAENKREVLTTNRRIFLLAQKTRKIIDSQTQ